MHIRDKTNKLICLGLALALIGSIAGGCAPATSQSTPGSETQPTPVPTPGSGEAATPTEELEPVTVSGPAEARDAALAYLAGVSPDQAPAQGQAWTEKRTTPEGLVGADSMVYSAGDWTVTVTYPVTSPEQVDYAVVVANQATGTQWEADVDAFGEVFEWGPVEGESQLTPTPAPSTGTTGTADIKRLVSGNNAFALDLYQALRSGSGNLFFSPYSISAALAMTYAGARGETEKQMSQALHFELPQAQLPPSFKALAEELAKRGQGAAGKDEKGFRLNIVNALWGQDGYEFLAAFLSLLSSNYGAGLERVDFSQPEKARAQINDWVSQQTEQRIQNLIPSGALNDATRLVLTNAIYFNAAWAMQFSKTATQDGPFTRLDGSQVTAPLMHLTESFGYAAGKGYQAVELPYDGRELSMVVLVPETGQFEGFESSLDAVQLDGILAKLSAQQVALTLPKFEFDSSFSLKATLSAMGMPVAFTGDADLTGMTSKRELLISDVFHKAFVTVDEDGTEAAAATAVVVGLTSMPVEPVEVKVDRPFLFLIRDLKTGAILFLGRVLDPTA
jgi:serpin B